MGPSGRQQLSRSLERAALPLAGVATAAVLVVVFYYPVGIVLAEALLRDGALTAEPVLEILSDPFYTGALHTLFADPLAVPAGLLAWARAGFGVVSFGLFGFTAWQAFLSTVASLALGLPGAYALSRFEFRGRRTLRSLTILPFVLPSILVAIGFVAMFAEQGVLNDALRAVGLPTVTPLYTLEIVVVAHAFYNAPLVTRVVTAAWEGVDARMTETARALGAPRWRAFLDVVLPQLLPAVLTGALLTFLFTFMTFPIVLALGGLRLATVEVWLYANVQQLELETAAALAVVETVVSLALTYAYLRYEGAQAGGLGGLGGTPERDRLFGRLAHLSDPRRLAILGYGAVVLVVFVGPLASMVAESFTGPQGVTLRHYRFLLERQVAGGAFQVKPLPAVRNSLLFGVATLLVAVPMGVVVSVVTTREFLGRKTIDALLMGPFAVSGIVVGLGLLQGLVFGLPVPFVGRVPVTGPVAIVAAHAAAAYPFVARTVTPMLERVDPQLVESARALGASRTRALLDVELPIVAPGVVAGAAFAFAISMGEFDATVLLAEGAQSYTMPVAVERYLGNRTLGPATAMGTVLLLVTAASFVVVDRVGGRYE
ncbi:ABC transporter permease [Halospeciosus flavus]|uniref:ABC transporter permease n=1 Tax=Halospeciosus flavus TaxID=3032283 RepID=UPI00361FFB15